MYTREKQKKKTTTIKKAKKKKKQTFRIINILMLTIK